MSPPQERYEPFPGFLRLPGWLWARTPLWGRTGLFAALAAAVVAAVLVWPEQRHEDRERRAREGAERAAALAARRDRLRREQRPRRRELRSPAATRSEKAAMRKALERDIALDARGRPDARRILRAECEPFPRRADRRDPGLARGARAGSYHCVAVTAEIPVGRASRGGVIGYPFRARIDFVRGSYAWCRTSGRPAEGALERAAPLPLSPVCR